MARSFAITMKDGSTIPMQDGSTIAKDPIRADAKGHAEVVFKVTNNTARPARALAVDVRVRADPPDREAGGPDDPSLRQHERRPHGGRRRLRRTEGEHQFHRLLRRPVQARAGAVG